MKNRRISDRAHSYAKAVFLFYDLIGYVRDISEEGLRIDILTSALPDLSPSVHTTIIPHPDLDLDPFNIFTQVRWSKQNGPTIAVGLKVIEYSSPHGADVFSHLVKIFEELNV